MNLQDQCDVFLHLVLMRDTFHVLVFFFSDLKFLIGPGRKAIFAHRCILSARCAVFKAMFADKASGGHDKEVPLVLSDMSPEIFLAMLEFIYTNCVTLSSKTVSTTRSHRLIPPYIYWAIRNVNNLYTIQIHAFVILTYQTYTHTHKSTYLHISIYTCQNIYS